MYRSHPYTHRSLLHDAPSRVSNWTCTTSPTVSCDKKFLSHSLLNASTWVRRGKGSDTRVCPYVKSQFCLTSNLLEIIPEELSLTASSNNESDASDVRRDCCSHLRPSTPPRYLMQNSDCVKSSSCWVLPSPFSNPRPPLSTPLC